MYEDDRDALAAEYVLGTLSTDERDQAEALIVIDQGFAEIVRQWERRLGELNVMVEAVEPPSIVWERISNEIKGAPTSVVPQTAGAAVSEEREIKAEESGPPWTEESVEPAVSYPPPDVTPELLLNFPPEPTLDFSLESLPVVSDQAVEQTVPEQPPSEPPPPEPLSPEPPIEQLMMTEDQELLEPIPEDQAARVEEAGLPEQVVQDRIADLLNIPSATQADLPSPVAALASSLSQPAVEPESQPAFHADVVPILAQPETTRSADVVRLTRKMRRWRRTTFVMGALAAALVAVIALPQLVPDLIPQLRQIPQLRRLAPAPAQAPASADRLVGALSQEPTAPAFLLTVDPSDQTLTVRAVSAKPESGRSYELWLILPQSKPRSLGVIGAQPFTRRPLPAGLDVDALRAADYAVSLEPEGGSPSGAPTGPVLFTGKLVNSLPGRLPPS